MTLFKKQKELKELTLKSALAKIDYLGKENQNLSNVIILQKENFQLCLFQCAGIFPEDKKLYLHLTCGLQ